MSRLTFPSLSPSLPPPRNLQRHHPHTGLVDGNEKLLRQVLDQFVSKTTATINDIKNVIQEAVVNPCQPQESDMLAGGVLRSGWEPWREKVRFEAQSVASAASTLGAAVLSTNSLDVETKVLEDESAVEIKIAVDVMAASFVAIKNVIESMTGREKSRAPVTTKADMNKVIKDTELTEIMADGDVNSQGSGHATPASSFGRSASYESLMSDVSGARVE